MLHPGTLRAPPSALQGRGFGFRPLGVQQVSQATCAQGRDPECWQLFPGTTLPAALPSSICTPCAVSASQICPLPSQRVEKAPSLPRSPGQAPSCPGGHQQVGQLSAELGWACMCAGHSEAAGHPPSLAAPAEIGVGCVGETTGMWGSSTNKVGWKEAILPPTDTRRAMGLSGPLIGGGRGGSCTGPHPGTNKSVCLPVGRALWESCSRASMFNHFMGSYLQSCLCRLL